MHLLYITRFIRIALKTSTDVLIPAERDLNTTDLNQQIDLQLVVTLTEPLQYMTPKISLSCHMVTDIYAATKSEEDI